MKKISKNLSGLLLGTLSFVFLCIALQHGPDIFYWFFRSDVKFVSIGDSRIEADIEKLPLGYYYLSLDRVLEPTEVFLDSVLIASNISAKPEWRNKLAIGVDFEISSSKHPNKVIIYWRADKSWRKTLYNTPFIAPYRIGIALHLLREWRSLFMGPAASLILLLLAFLSLGVGRGSKLQNLSLCFVACSAFVYSAISGGILDLFYPAGTSLFLHVFLRCIFSLSLTLLAGVYAKNLKFLLWAHIICLLVIVTSSDFYSHATLVMYGIQIALFAAASLVMTFLLILEDKYSLEIQLLRQLYFAWGLLQTAAVVVYFTKGPSFLTLISPAFITALACAGCYLIYREFVASIEQNVSSKAEMALAVRMNAMVTQVAHDLRSPLALLGNMFQRNSQVIPLGDKEVADSAIERMRVVADTVLSEYKISKSKGSISIPASLSGKIELGSVSEIIDDVLQAKRIEFLKFSELKFEARYSGSKRHLYYALFNVVDLQRTLSNIINNAVEAIKHRGQIEICINVTNTNVLVSIIDTGPGIPSDFLPKIKAGGFSYGKENGNGLGVSFARQCMERWGGELLIESEVDKGTVVTLVFLKPMV